MKKEGESRRSYWMYSSGDANVAMADYSRTRALICKRERKSRGRDGGREREIEGEGHREDESLQEGKREIEIEKEEKSVSESRRRVIRVMRVK